MYEQKLITAFEELTKSGCWKNPHPTGLYGLLYRFGFRYRPGQYQHPLVVFLWSAIAGSVGYGGLMWIFGFSVPLKWSIILGVLLGIVLVAGLAHERRKYNLSKWSDL